MAMQGEVSTSPGSRPHAAAAIFACRNRDCTRSFIEWSYLVFWIGFLRRTPSETVLPRAKKCHFNE